MYYIKTKLVDAVVGMKLKHGKLIISCLGMTYRIIEENENKKMLTMDYKTDRVNLVTQDNIIKSLYIG